MHSSHLGIPSPSKLMLQHLSRHTFAGEGLYTANLATAPVHSGPSGAHGHDKCPHPTRQSRRGFGVARGCVSRRLETAKETTPTRLLLIECSSLAPLPTALRHVPTAPQFSPYVAAGSIFINTQDRGLNSQRPTLRLPNLGVTQEKPDRHPCHAKLQQLLQPARRNLSGP